MEKLSKKKLQELGFEESYCRWDRGNVFLTCYEGDSEMEVYVSARITGGEDYARPALGVKNEKDLLMLCKLVNG